MGPTELEWRLGIRRLIAAVRGELVATSAPTCRINNMHEPKPPTPPPSDVVGVDGAYLRAMVQTMSFSEEGVQQHSWPVALDIPQEHVVRRLDVYVGSHLAASMPFAVAGGGYWMWVPYVVDREDEE